MQPVVLYEGKFLRLVQAGHWEYAERTNTSGAVVIVAVTKHNQLLLTEQDRIPMGKRVIELPAGLVGDDPGSEGELAEQAVRRELLEETGYEAGEIEFLDGGPPSAGLSNEVVLFYRAGKLKKRNSGGGRGHEKIEVHSIGLADVFSWLKARRRDGGVLVDPKVYAGLFLLQQNGRLGK